MEKKKYIQPNYVEEVIYLNDVILTSGNITKSDGNHSFGVGSDLTL